MINISTLTKVLTVKRKTHYPIYVEELVTQYEENLRIIEQKKFDNDVIKAKLMKITPEEGIRVKDYLISLIKGKETISFNSKQLKKDNESLWQKYVIKKISEPFIKITRVR